MVNNPTRHEMVYVYDFKKQYISPQHEDLEHPMVPSRTEGRRRKSKMKE